MLSSRSGEFRGRNFRGGGHLSWSFYFTLLYFVVPMCANKNVISFSFPHYSCEAIGTSEIFKLAV